MKRRLLGVAICYAVTMVVLQHFLPAYWGRMTLAVLAVDLGACYVRSLMFKRQMEAAMELALQEDAMALEDETFN